MSSCSYNDNEDDGVRFEERLSLSHLRMLESWFTAHKPPPRRHQRAVGEVLEERLPGLLNRNEFKHVIEKVLGTDEYSLNLDTLFTKVRVQLDVSCDG